MLEDEEEEEEEEEEPVQIKGREKAKERVDELVEKMAQRKEEKTEVEDLLDLERTPSGRVRRRSAQVAVFHLQEIAEDELAKDWGTKRRIKDDLVPDIKRVWQCWSHCENATLVTLYFMVKFSLLTNQLLPTNLLLINS